VVVVDGPAGIKEVDTRPSDAVTLAAVTGTPVRVDARLLAELEMTGWPEWKSYPTGAAELAAEVERRIHTVYAKRPLHEEPDLPPPHA
jgi:hypothetical protein